MKPGIGLSPSRDRLSMETIFTFGYNLSMQFLVRMIAVAVLAAFVAGSLAHAAGAAEMAVTMVSSSDAAMGMSDCETCADPDTDNAGSQCQLICMGGSFTAIPAPQPYLAFTPRAKPVWLAVTNDMLGFTGPPAKEPPKSLI